jgi:hypothetical protein
MSFFNRYAGFFRHRQKVGLGSLKRKKHPTMADIRSLGGTVISVYAYARFYVYKYVLALSLRC